jgi:hypothetical protein
MSWKISLLFWKKIQIKKKTNLHVLFLLDVIIWCSIMYNRILDNKDLEIEVHGSIKFEFFCSYVHQAN